MILNWAIASQKQPKTFVMQKVKAQLINNQLYNNQMVQEILLKLQKHPMIRENQVSLKSGIPRLCLKP